ncbi:MAG TPA: hypothetical protein VFX12_02175 [Vicinamibacterales bacterium]|nr:hypothetical protein [Vicinamibacterales bacterium]
MLKPTRHPLPLVIVSALLACAGALVLLASVGATGHALPSRLSDADFWALVTSSSEQDGYFRSDNLLSNELGLQEVIPDLVARTSGAGRVYMGVGPEQNFTYIAALQPRMAFIVDVRRGNLDLQLMYKALFELSKDRADFVAGLFSRQRPPHLTKRSTAAEIFDAVAHAATSDALYRANLKRIEDQLTKVHGFALKPADLQGIEYVASAFHTFGPDIQYSSTGSFGGRYQPTYADLMTATDEAGKPRSYLATEQNFDVLEKLESKNLIVPVVGNFAGPKAIRAVGSYIRGHGSLVSAFYLSNVEQYLYQQDLWSDFCRNVATLPLDAHSTFIRSTRHGGYGRSYRRGFGLMSELGRMADEVRTCGPAGSD